MKLIFENPVACTNCVNCVIVYDIVDDYGYKRFDQEMEFSGTEAELHDRIQQLKYMGAYDIEVVGEPGIYESKKSCKEDYGYVHDEEEAKLSPSFQSYLRRTGWVPFNIDGNRYYMMDFNYGNLFCDIYIDEWGNCYLVTDGDDLRPSDMFYTIVETKTDVIDDLITLGNTIASTGDVQGALDVFFN